MRSWKRNSVRSLCVLLVLGLFGLSFSGCAGGNFNLVRSVAKWNLRMSLLPRVIVYLAFIIIPVYPIALLLDAILFNTIEFWTGKPVLTAKNQKFEKDGVTVEIAHFLDPLRRTVITSTMKDGSRSLTELRETEGKSIEIYVDQIKRGEVQNIDQAIATVLTFKDDGLSLERSREIEVNSFQDLPDDQVSLNRIWVASALEADTTATACAR
ncbi:MAG: DUF3332 family protein [Bdellovibrionota bacterium]